jgi:hypothetical protein
MDHKQRWPENSRRRKNQAAERFPHQKTHFPSFDPFSGRSYIFATMWIARDAGGIGGDSRN